MADVMPETPFLQAPISPATAPAVPPSREVVPVEIGLAIGFGLVFLFGVIAWLAWLFDAEPDRDSQ